MRLTAKIAMSLVFFLGVSLQAQTNPPQPPGGNEPMAAATNAAEGMGAKEAAPATPAAGGAQDLEETLRTELIRRQEASTNLVMLLRAAQAAEKRGEMMEASAAYLNAVKQIPLVEVGNPAVDMEKRAAIGGLDATCETLAREAMKEGSLGEASQRVGIALQYDPTNARLQTLRTEIEHQIASQAGRVPSAEVVNTIPGIEKSREDVATLVQDGKLLYELGRYDEAEAKFKEVLEKDKSNTAAPYYMDLLQEARYFDAARRREIGTKSELLDVEKEWLKENKNEKLPQPNPYVTNTLQPVYDTSGRQTILHKLKTIPFELDFDQPIPLSDVLRVLKDESKKRDVEQKGINFIYNPNAGGSPPAAGADAALAAAAPVAAGPVDVQDIHVKVSPALDNLTLYDALDAICKVATLPPGTSSGGLTYSIEDYAIYFFVKPPEAVPLYTRTFHVDPNTFIQGLQNVAQATIAGSANETGGGGGGGFGGGGFGGGGFGGGGFGGGGFGGGGYGGGGYGGGGYGGGGYGGGGYGGNGGYGGGGNGGGGLGASSGSVAYPIVTLAGTTGGGGGGGRGGSNGVASTGGLPYVTSVQDTTNESAVVRAYFANFGVNLMTNGAFVFFNDRAGEILCRATEHDLEIIALAIELLNKYPPEVTIDTKFASVTQTDTKGIGFQWWLGNFTTANGAIGAEAGTAPSYTGAPTANNPSGIFPGASIANAIAPAASDGSLTAGLENTVGTQAASMPTLATVTGILTDPQFRMAIQAIQQRNGSDLLSAPRVTTLSTRQAHVAVQDIVDIVTSVELGETSSTGVGATSSIGGLTGGAAIAASSSYATTPFVEGPSLDVMPTVSADGFSIQMVLIPTYTEFVGYDPPGAFVPQATSVSSSALGVPITAVLPLPHYRVRQAVTSVNVWDGQTVVLGGLISETITKQKDEVPVLGDLPLVGRFFRDETSQSSKENLLIFVTPTIIDPAGNRVHKEDMSDMPWAKNSIPAQPAQNP